MSNIAWISIAAIIVSTVVSLTIAALHRKQMRQIELRRLDPSVPVIPPPYPATRFIQRNWVNGVFIVSVIVEVSILTHLMLQTGPITRGYILNIALGTASLAYVILMRSIVQTTDEITNIYVLINKLIDVVAAHNKTIEAQTKAIDAQAKWIGAQTETIDVHTKLIEGEKPT